MVFFYVPNPMICTKIPSECYGEPSAQTNARVRKLPAQNVIDVSGVVALSNVKLRGKEPVMNGYILCQLFLFREG